VSDSIIIKVNDLIIIKVSDSTMIKVSISKTHEGKQSSPGVSFKCQAFIAASINLEDKAAGMEDSKSL
jgi:hypothetical protein